MKNFILSNHYTRQLGYEIKAIMQYQAAHSGGDAMNPQFNVRPVFFIKKTESNKELDFGKTTDADLLIKDAIPITTEAYLTQNLDTYFGNCLRTGALVMIIIASVLNSIGALIKESLMGKDELVIDFEEIEKAKARQENPHLKEYHNKLKELMQSEVSSKDNFINWITGLSSGTLLFIFAQNKQLIYTEMTILCAGRALFLQLYLRYFLRYFLM